MKNKYLIALFALILCLNELAAQSSHWDYYTNSEDVQEIIIDGGYVWAATYGGLVQVDRNSLHTVACHRGNSRLPSHRIAHLEKDGKGIVFIHAGKESLQIAGNEMISLRDELGGIPAKGRFGSMWVAGDSGIWKKTRATWAKVEDLPEAANWYILSDFVVDPFNEDLWLTGWTFGSFRIFHFDGNEWETFGNENSDLPFESPGNNKLLFDQRGDLWAAAQGGLYTYDGNQWKHAFISPDLGTSFYCSAIHLDDEKRLWVACNNGWNTGARLFSKDGEQWIEYPLQDSIGVINDIQVSQNEIWLATQGQGIHLHKEGGAWQRIFLSNSLLPGNWISALDWDPLEKKLWVGAQGKGPYSGGLFKVENGKLIPEAIPPINYVRQIVRDPNGPLWLVGSDAVFVKNGRFWNNFNPIPGRIEPKYIEAISFDYQGVLWMIHNDELAIHQWNNQYKFLSLSDVKQTAAIYNLFNHPDRNEAWVSSYSEFSHFNGGRWNSSQEMLGEKVIMYDAVADDQGAVWLATDKGLLRYDSLKYEWVKSPTNDRIKFRSITQKPDGSLWLTTRNKIWKFTEELGFFAGNDEGWGAHNSPLADRAELLQSDDKGNLWIAADGLGVWHDDLLPWTAPHEIGIGGELAQGESLIYPNPVSAYGDLNVFIKGEMFDQLKIIDVQGKEVISVHPPQATEYFQLSLDWGPMGYHYLPGTYLLSVFKEDKLLVTKKIQIFRP